MKDEEIQKPLTVILEDAKKELVNAINKISEENGLSFFFLDLIVGDIYKEIVQMKQQEATQARNTYLEQLKENRKESEK